MDFKLFNSGYCSTIEKFAITTAPWRCCKFPAMFALIRHPNYGNILFDTGHSDRFYQLTQTFPLSIYRWIVHVEHSAQHNAVYQLEKEGLSPGEINYIFISHFHADHVGSLRDFPNAKFVYLKEAYEAVKKLKYFSALRAGFLPGLLPNDFDQRSLLLNDLSFIKLTDEYFPFKTGYQIFSDDSLIAVHLPGHAQGQIGLFVRVSDTRTIFLIADAAWMSVSYKKQIPPHRLAFLIMSGRKQYLQTMSAINLLNKRSPHIEIIPSHCPLIWNEYNSQDHTF